MAMKKTNSMSSTVLGNDVVYFETPGWYTECDLASYSEENNMKRYYHVIDTKYEYVRWCLDHLGYYPTTRLSDTNEFIIYLDSDEDATLFKLKWL
jgi:hypothetical protein